MVKQAFFWTQQGNCTYELTAALTACIRPVQDKAIQNSITGGKADTGKDTVIKLYP